MFGCIPESFLCYLYLIFDRKLIWRKRNRKLGKGQKEGKLWREFRGNGGLTGKSCEREGEKRESVVGALDWGVENYVWESRVAKVRIARTGDDAKWEDGLQLSVEHLQIKVDNCCCCMLSAWNHRHLQISTSLPLSLVLRQFGSTSKLSPSDWRALDRDQDDSVAVETVDGGDLETNDDDMFETSMSSSRW